MAIRCSVLGHAWGEPEVERAREQRGTKLVVATREVKVCDRCGAREVLDEQTEDAVPVGAGDDEPDDEPAVRVSDPKVLEHADVGDEEWPDPSVADDEEVDYEPRPWPEAEPPDPNERGPDEPDVIEAAEPAGGRRGRAGESVDPAEVLSEAAEEQADDTADASESEAEEPPDPEELDLEDVEVYCPKCSFVDETPKPTLRGGDSCPNCRDSYLKERDA